MLKVFAAINKSRYLETTELKLLGYPNYQSTISVCRLKSITARDKLCRALGDRGLVDFSHEIATVKIYISRSSFAEA